MEVRALMSVASLALARDGSSPQSQVLIRNCEGLALEMEFRVESFESPGWRKLSQAGASVVAI